MTDKRCQSCILARSVSAEWTEEQHIATDKGNMRPCLGEIGSNQRHADSEVSLVEVIGYIPAQLAILTPLLHHCMEESQHPHQWPECLQAAQLFSLNAAYHSTNPPIACL